MNTPRKKLIARTFRRSPTETEAAMWEALRDRRFMGLKFRRQYIVQGFILDFYCPELKFAVEIDGCVHREQEESDARRQKIVEESGIVFFRTSSEKVNANLCGVLMELASFISTLLPDKENVFQVRGEWNR